MRPEGSQGNEFVVKPRILYRVDASGDGSRYVPRRIKGRVQGTHRGDARGCAQERKGASESASQGRWNASRVRERGSLHTSPP